MHVHWLQHAEHEGLGCIAPWLDQNGHTHAATRLHAGEKPPGIETFDALIVMGGPMNIYQHTDYPWLSDEMSLLRVALDTGKRVLGICLGAQLVAEALGIPGEPNVVRNAATELGFLPVTMTAEGRTHPLFAGLPDPFTAFHWHSDTYRLPKAAVNLAASQACGQQAFALEDGRIAGLQFHLEVTPENAREWFREMPTEQGSWVQTPQAILANTAAFEANNAAMRTVLKNFFGD